MSFFTEATHQFLPIPEDTRIETKPFLDAASEVVPFFGEYAFPCLKINKDILFLHPYSFVSRGTNMLGIDFKFSTIIVKFPDN